MSAHPNSSRPIRACTPERALTPGFTLVELMVALAIGSLLLVGTVSVYTQGRTSYRVNETITRLQEDARLALDLLEADIRMASYFGLQSRPSMIENRAGAGEPTPAGLGVVGNCRPNWAIDLSLPVEVSNNAYTWAAGCPAYGAGPVAGADSIIVRRVSEDPVVVLDPDTMHLQSARFRTSLLFVGTSVPLGFSSGGAAVHELITNGYYVSQSSNRSPGTPSLRRYFLDDGPQIRQEEILPGVEDMQIQYGVDTDAIGDPNRGSVNRYVNADDPIIDPLSASYDSDAQIIAVRIWLLVRSEQTENGFTDDRAYTYADRNVAAPNDAYRRMLVSRTIYLRNVRTIF